MPAINFGEAASGLRSGGVRTGKPSTVNLYYSAKAGSVPGEVKHLSTQRKINRIDSVSSGERKRNSLNLFTIAILWEGVIGTIHLNFLHHAFCLWCKKFKRSYKSER